MNLTKRTVLFLDIGDVLLSNGWDRDMRERAAHQYDLDYDEMEERHHLTFDTYEEGKLSLEEYLARVVFYRKRPFSLEDFKTFMFSQSQAKADMLDYVSRLKKRYNLTVAAVSNEGRELTVWRIDHFNLTSIIDFFISSCFVHLRKPDKEIYRLALDCAQVEAEQVIYIDDRKMFVEIASSLGIRGVHHTDFLSTRARLDELGLVLEEEE